MPDDDTTMPGDEQDTDSQQTSAPEQTDAAAPEASPADQQAHGDQPTTPVAPDTKPDDGSLTKPDQTPQDNQPPARDWTKEGPTLEKRLRDQQSYFDKQISQWRQQMQQTQSKSAELEKWKQEQEQRAKAASLKPWSKAHPENAKFNGVLERAKVIEQQLRRIPANLPPEQQEAMRQAIVGALSPEEQSQIQEYRESLTSFQKDFFTDPHGTLLPMVEQLAEQKVQQALQQIEARQSVQRDFEDPTLKPLLEKHKDEFAKALQDMPQNPYEYAKHLMVTFAENQKLKEQLAKYEGKVAAADEQRRLSKSEASHTRDPRAAEQDPYELATSEAKRRGIPLDSPRFAGLLSKYTKG
jgi:hypothetical protein